MTEAKKPATRKAAPRKKPEVKTVAEQQREAFLSPNGKSQALAFFEPRIQALLMGYSTTKEMAELVKSWDELQDKVASEIEVSVLMSFLPGVKRLLDLVFGENAEIVLETYWDGNMMAFFNDTRKN